MTGLWSFSSSLVGLEIKREMVKGELSSLKRSILPVVAAIGGVVLPSLIYDCIEHWGSGDPPRVGHPFCN